MFRVRVRSPTDGVMNAWSAGGVGEVLWERVWERVKGR